MAGPRLRRNDGFSLIEVLVALTILAVGLLALALFQVTAIRGNAIASKWTVATQLSQERLDRFRHLPWDNIVSSPASGYNTGTMEPVYANLPGAQGDNTSVRGTQFFRVWSVTNTTTTLKMITVWTCWKDELSNWHSVMLVSQRVNIGGV